MSFIAHMKCFDTLDEDALKFLGDAKKSRKSIKKTQIRRTEETFLQLVLCKLRDLEIIYENK